MIQIKNERVVSFSRSYQDVFWEIESTTEDLQDYEFYVERAEAEGGPYYQIAGPLIDRYYVRDNAIPMYSTNRTFFYKIHVRKPSTGEEFWTDRFDRIGPNDLISDWIISCEKVLFEEFVGTLNWLFPIRTFGQRCPQCWNTTLQKKNMVLCPTCFGTSFSGGYHYPIAFWGQVDPTESVDQQTVEDLKQVRYSVMRCGPSPDIKPRDIIIDFKNSRFKVLSASGTSRLGVAVHQEIRMVEVQKGSVEDTIPLKIDHSDVQLTPPRNFNMPSSLEAVDGEVDLSRILRLYGY